MSSRGGSILRPDEAIFHLNREDCRATSWSRNDRKGFTLIELLVVISIIAILSVIGVTVFSGVQKNARNIKRMADMKAIQQALEIYYYANNSIYPITFTSPATPYPWRSECAAYGGFTADQVIPGLVPDYLASMPADPAMDTAASRSCYLYKSNGTNYKLLDHSIAEFSAADYQKQPSLVDPARMYWSWQISTPLVRSAW